MVNIRNAIPVSSLSNAHSRLLSMQVRANSNRYGSMLSSYRNETTNRSGTPVAVKSNSIIPAPEKSIPSFFGGDPLKPGKELREQQSQADFAVGQRAESDINVTGRYCACRITRVRPGKGQSFLYDVTYEDGEKADGIEKKNLRSASQFRKDMKIEADYERRGKYYTGVVTAVIGTEYYNIRYDDNTTELRVHRNSMRLFDSYLPGTSVEVAFSKTLYEKDASGMLTGVETGSGQTFYRGKVEVARNDGSYDIKFNDGSVECGVDDRRITCRFSYEVGALVEANFKRIGKFYPGKITKVWRSGLFKFHDIDKELYDIAYNDGDKESRVEAGHIRPMIPSTTCSSSPFKASGSSSIAGTAAVSTLVNQTGKHIMISYCWTQKVLVTALAMYLREKHGYDVWIDELGSSVCSKMSGASDAKMAEAVEKSHTVIVFVSKEYYASVNCQKEAKYAHQRRDKGKVKIHYVMMQRDYTTVSKPDCIEGALALWIGDEIWYSLFEESQVVGTGDSLADLIGEQGKLIGTSI